MLVKIIFQKFQKQKEWARDVIRQHGTNEKKIRHDISKTKKETDRPF